MNLYENRLYIEDLRRPLETMDLSPLSGKTVLITGASGLIGTVVTDMLLEYNSVYGTDIRIVAAVHNYEKAKQRLRQNSALTLVQYDALNPVSFSCKADYIIHAASNASPDAYVKKPVETLMGIVGGTYEMIKLAIQSNTLNFLYVSSSEVYGIRDNDEASKEDEYGFIDILSPRSSYSMGKRAAETLCIGYANEFNRKVTIIRPGHIYGPAAKETDQRVSSSFAYLAARGEDLVLKSSGLQMRSYCYAVDCASAILTVLVKGENCEAYNISNKSSVITIREMAEYYAKAGDVSVVFQGADNREKAAFNPMSNSSLNSEKLELLGWKASFGAEEGLKHTVRILRECINQ